VQASASTAPEILECRPGPPTAAARIDRSSFVVKHIIIIAHRFVVSRPTATQVKAVTYRSAYRPSTAASASAVASAFAGIVLPSFPAGWDPSSSAVVGWGPSSFTAAGLDPSSSLIIGRDPFAAAFASQATTSLAGLLARASRVDHSRLQALDLPFAVVRPLVDLRPLAEVEDLKVMLIPFIHPRLELPGQLALDSNSRVKLRQDPQVELQLAVVQQAEHSLQPLVILLRPLYISYSKL